MTANIIPLTMTASQLARVQQNEYAVQPLVIYPKGEQYQAPHLRAMDDMLRQLQQWVFTQAGVTFCRLPAKRINGAQTVQEYANGNIYLQLAEQLKTQEVFDSRMRLIRIGKPDRLYVLAAAGNV